MFSKYVIPSLILIATLGIFCLLFFVLYRKVEGFVGEQETNASEKELRDLLNPVISRLCTLQKGVIETIAKNKSAPEPNTEPTMGEAKRAAEDAKKGEAERKGQGQPLTPEQIQAAFLRLVAEAQHLLVKCPIPDDLTQLPASFAEDLAVTGVFLYRKLYLLNKQLQESLSGDTPPDDDSNDSDDPFKGLAPIPKAAAMKKYQELVKQMEENSKVVELTPTEKEALLQQRLKDLKELFERTNEKGEKFIDAYLTSAEDQYAQLQKAKNGEVKYEGPTA